MPSVTMTATMPSVKSISASGGSPPSINDLTISQIKERARKEIPILLKGVTPSNSLTSAKRLGEAALLAETAGEGKRAFYDYQRVAQILATVSKQQEFKSNQQQLLPQFEDVFQWMKINIVPRSTKLEGRLKEEEEEERLRDKERKENEANESVTPLPSVADRIKSLEKNGLTLQSSLMAAATTAKSRRTNPPNAPSKPSRLSNGSLAGLSSPTSPTVKSFAASEPMPLQASNSYALFPPPPSPGAPSQPHPQFVPASVFGPPSPTSSAPPSPYSSNPDLSVLTNVVGAIGAASPDFDRAFPPLDEWEEILEHGTSATINDVKSSGFGPSQRGDQIVPPSSFQRSPTTPHVYQSPLPSLGRRFSLLSLDRPASTPPRPLPVPDSPTNENGPLTEGVTPLAPRDIYSLQQRKKEVLFFDLRSRERWDAERVKGDVICVEPTFLTHDLTAERLSSALELSSKQERLIFENRRMFSLVVIYEENEPTDLSRAVAHALWDMEFRKESKLKKAPVLMTGGFKRWKDDVGESGVIGSISGSGKLRGSGSAVSLRSTGSGGTGHEGGHVSRQATGQKLSPTSTANGWATPAPPKASPMSPSIVSGPSINGISPISSSLQSPRQVSPPRADRPPVPQTSSIASQPPPELIEPPSRETFIPPRPAIPSAPPAQFWVPPASSREQDDSSRLLRRPPSYPTPNHFSTSNHGNFDQGYSLPPSRPLGPSAPITYPSQPTRSVPPIQMPQPEPLSTSSSSHASSLNGVVSPPAPVSIRPSPISRRRSDYLDQPSQPPPSSYSPANGRHSIDYPSFSSQNAIRPPPPAAADRYGRVPNGTAQYLPPVPQPKPNGVSAPVKLVSGTIPNGPIIPSDYPVMYWSDYQVSTSGLKNLGNTCYMNSTIQCLSSVYPFAIYFSDGRFKSAINRANTMGSKGEVALAFASLLHQMRQGDMVYLTPYGFRKSICTYAPQFSGSDQHDTEEFLNFLLDGLHEDLNRVTQKIPYKPTPEREAELELLPQQIASEQEWRIYRMSNNSIVVDYFQGQFRNRLQCLTCKKTSTTYNPFSDLSLPIPAGRGVSKVSLQQCLEAFVKEEIMEKSDAWHCPSCKTLRKASKQLSLSRLPAVLIIVLKRFSIKGPFTDKLETLVEFPIKDLDLTNYMPPPLPPSDQNLSFTKSMNMLREDPSTQVPPYRYDLFAVTNHYGSLSSGHYTAFINARGGWQYCDDSRVTPADTKDIVSKAAYVLYYKRSRPT